MMKVEEALQNVFVVISEFRGTVNGQVLTNREQVGLLDSFKLVVDEIKRLNSVEEEFNKKQEDIEEKKV